MKERESLFERIISRAKNNRVTACLLALGTLVIALATFTDAAKRISKLVVGQGPQEARIELSKMSLEYSPNVFVRSVQENDVEAVKLFIAAGMDVNARNAIGETALGDAAREGDTGMVRLLLNAKANVIERDSYQRTALFWAASKGRIDVLQLLLKNDANNESRNEAIEGAAIFGRPEILPILKKVGAGDPQTYSRVLVWTANSGRATDEKLQESMKFLLDNGADPNGSADEDGWTALMWAVQTGRKDSARDLLKHGANVNAKNSDGKTALMLAVAGGADDIIRDLLEHGARINEKDASGQTAVGIAIRELHGDRRVEIMRLLKGSAVR